jgi:two-component system LytT family response regulator
MRIYRADFSSNSPTMAIPHSTRTPASAWLRSNVAADPIFMDIQLSDGLSLNLVKEMRIGCPVIFVTAYWQEAFEYNSIDYLLKPVKRS